MLQRILLSLFGTVKTISTDTPAGLLEQRTTFESRPVHVTVKVALGQVSLRILWFSTVSFIALTLYIYSAITNAIRS